MKKSNYICVLKYLILILFILIKTETGFSQNIKPYSEITAVYKITDEEAKELFQDDELEITEAHFHNFIDTFSNLYPQRQPLKGYYLFVRTIREELEIQLQSFNTISAVVLNNQRDLTVQVMDSLGNILKNAEVIFRKSKLKYDKTIQAFQKKKTHKSGFLTIKANGETVFYKVHGNRKISLLKKRYFRFRSTKLGWVLTTPFRWGRKGWYFFKHGIKYHRWNWGIFRRQKKRKGKSHRGYIVLNQPKYQPGDTVKIKGYLTTHKGKPLTEDLRIEIYRNYRKPIISTFVSPKSKGAYTYEFVLGDSLQLDKNYTIAFSKKKRKPHALIMWHRFYYEDYQLDEVEYSFESNQKQYSAGEKIILFAEGKDQNDWTIPDGKIQIIATPSPVDYFHGNQILVPDTLWQHTQVLDSRGLTQIIFPSEKIPEIKTTVNIQAKFSNSNGELHTKNLTFTYLPDDGKIEAALEGEYVTAKYLVNGKEVEKNAQLLVKYTQQKNKEKRKVKLPFKERVNSFVENYHFRVDRKEKPINFYQYQPQIVTSSHQTKDSIFVTIINPRKLLVTYQVRRNNIITKGQSDEKLISIQQKIKKNKAAFLHYQYVWRGRAYDKKQSIIFYKNLLSIDVEQPQTVESGAQVQFKVAVKTAENKPAKNVNLTAGAINSQFEKMSNIKEPQINYKISKTPFRHDRFNFTKLEKPTDTKIIKQRWYDELQLNSSLFYQLRHPHQGVFFHYQTINSPDTFYQNIAQFAPYVVKDGKTEPIYLIYCNRELVYYYDVDDKPPYSFIGREGYNQITIRTRKFVYTVDSVLLKNGQKLEFSIDEHNYLKSSFGKNISRKLVPNELTSAEKRLLNRTIFIIRKTYSPANTFLWQGKNRIHQINTTRKDYKVGPFVANHSLRILKQDGWANTFKFEPGFVYEVEKNRERLYKSEHFNLKNKIVLPFTLPQKKIGQLVFTPNIIKPKTSFYTRLATRFLTTGHRPKAKNSGRLILKNYPNQRKDSTIYAIVLLENDTIFKVYRPHIRRFNNLPQKDYSLIFFTQHGNYFKKDISIRANHSLYLKLENTTFTNDSSQTYFNKIFLKYSQQEGKQDEAKLYLSQRKTHPNNLPTYGSFEISGVITDEQTGEILIGASVMISKNGTFTAGVSTDIDGQYILHVAKGIYTLEVSYTGYESQKLEDIIAGSEANVSLRTGEILQEIMVVAYRLPGITQNETTASHAVTSSQIRNLPTRNINAVAASTAGSSSLGETDSNPFLQKMQISDNYLPANQQDFNNIALRTQFADYAYFHPNLITDQNGEAYFTATFPDNITAWKTYVVGMDDHLRAGTSIGKIRAFKKLTAQLALPRFLVEGDETNIIGKSINFTLDSFNITTAFKIGDEIIQTNQALVKDALIEKTKITTPENRDSLTLSYLLSMENYDDGEERSIPIFPKGTKETHGVFKVLENDKMVEMEFDPTHGEVQIRIEDNILNVLLEDLKYLKNYPYGCNEQTASRLIALLLEKDLQKILGQKFTDEKKIRKTIKRLKKTQNDDGSWGWWQGGAQNIWMTTYVLSALEKAKQAEYKTEALDKGLFFLTNHLEQLDGKNLLHALLLFSEVKQNLDYERYLIQLDSTQTSMYDKLALIKIRQSQHLTYDMDFLIKNKKEDLFGGWYFGKENYHWYNNSFQITLLAHDIFKHLPKEKINKDWSFDPADYQNATQRIEQYFLTKRNKNGWRNTIETAKILSVILPSLTKRQTGENALVKNKVQLSGAMNQTVSKFPFDVTFASDEILKVNKSGSSPVFFSAYQDFWNKNPKKKTDIFSIKTHLTQEGKKTTKLQAATAADLHVSIKVKKSAEYVMIEIPIPAGCSYRSKPNNRWSHESHREYFKDRVAIFCEDLPVGNYEFTIPLEPRFSGNYTLNPTRAEQMYFPVFYGRNEMGRVRIEN